LLQVSAETEKEEHNMRKGSGTMGLLGFSREDRLKSLCEVATVLHEGGNIIVKGWRRTLCKAAALKIGQPSKASTIYDYIQSLPAEDLAQIRIAAIGKEASDLIESQTRGNRVCGQKRTPFDLIVDSMPTVERTIRGVARLCNVPTFKVVSLAYENAAFRSKLCDGNTVAEFWKKAS
jgi:hypothetical protein